MIIREAASTTNIPGRGLYRFFSAAVFRHLSLRSTKMIGDPKEKVGGNLGNDFLRINFWLDGFETKLARLCL